MDLNAVSVTLPPEILDKILMEIPMHRDGHGRQTLIACALVATWWTGPSQRRLFSSVEVDDWNYEQWMNGVVFSRSKAYLLGYVLSLSRCRGPTYGRWGRMQDIPEDSVQYFSALRNLRSLSFFDTAFKHINEERFRPCFSAFRETLTHLSFVSLATSFGAFVTFVNHFPNITSLELSLSVVRPDDGPVPPLSRPLRGKLHVHKTITNCVEFFNRFAMLDPEYEELVIDSSIVFSRTEFVEIALRISPKTVKFLKLIDSLRGNAMATIHDFERLQELEVKVKRPNHAYKILLSSISSTELRKIVFLVWPEFHQLREAWVPIDEQLCGLADRLHAMGCRHSLEVELRVREAEGDPESYDPIKVLPGFREKGVVTIIDCGW